MYNRALDIDQSDANTLYRYAKFLLVHKTELEEFKRAESMLVRALEQSISVEDRDFTSSLLTKARQKVKEAEEKLKKRVSPKKQIVTPEPNKEPSQADIDAADKNEKELLEMIERENREKEKKTNKKNKKNNKKN